MGRGVPLPELRIWRPAVKRELQLSAGMGWAGVARGAARDYGDRSKHIVTIANVAAAARRPPPAARKRFRNLKCGGRIQRGFTYRGSDNFKIICG